jgi:hypothetical protein
MVRATIRTYPAKSAYLIMLLSWVVALVLSIVLHGWATSVPIPALCAAWTVCGGVILACWGFGGALLSGETWFDLDRIKRNLKYRRVVASASERKGFINIIEEGGGSYASILGQFSVYDEDDAMTCMENAKAKLKESRGEHQNARQLVRTLNR